MELTMTNPPAGGALGIFNENFAIEVSYSKSNCNERRMMLFLISGLLKYPSTLLRTNQTTVGEGSPTIMLTNKFYSLYFLYACLFYYLLKFTGF